ncbi:MAG: hypothetical protein HZC29_05155 [Thaumarchaeota archaeon]|nr:hypothetical protein [Nitrososphaerota archaeon]
MSSTIKFPITIKDFHPQRGYPNAERDGLLCWKCQACGARKLDCDLYPDTGLCGDCQFQQWEAQRTPVAQKYHKPYKPMGLYGLEDLNCGCSVKHYTGGLVKLQPDIRCTNEPKHTVIKIQWICPTCNKEFPTKKTLRKHKEVHAY